MERIMYIHQSKQLLLKKEIIKNVNFAIVIPGIKKWSAETPELYQLLIRIKDHKNRLLEATNLDVGFRSIELKNAQLLVNGVAVLFKGVNLHDHDPVTGHLVTVRTFAERFEIDERIQCQCHQM